MIHEPGSKYLGHVMALCGAASFNKNVIDKQKMEFLLDYTDCRYIVGSCKQWNTWKNIKVP